jgi:hypothetical protein
MKIKTIFVILNAVLGVAFLVIFLTPVFMLGGDWSSLFWSRNWPIALVFLIALGTVDAYFFLNWKLFEGLEREDWAAVAGFLENKIYHRGWVSAMRVRLLLNTYLVTSNTESIRALETFLRGRKPRLIGQFSLQFSIPYLLSKDPKEPEAFFRELLSLRKVSDRDWVRWNHAFSLLQMKSGEEAAAELGSLAQSGRDPVLQLLSVYLLDVVAKDDPQLEKKVSDLRGNLRERSTPQEMSRTIEKAGGNMEVIVLSRMLHDAVEWLYAAPAAR